MHGEKRRKYNYKMEQSGQSRFFIPRYKLSLLFCILNINFPLCIVVEISVMKNAERKKKEKFKEE